MLYIFVIIMLKVSVSSCPKQTHAKLCTVKMRAQIGSVVKFRIFEFFVITCKGMQPHTNCGRVIASEIP